MNKNQLLIPSLRFKGFNEEWEEENFYNCIKIFDGPHKTPQYFDSGIPFYSVETITNGIFRFIDNKQYESFKKIYTPQIGDILFSRIGTIGKTKVVNDINFSIYVSICALRLKTNKINNLFLNYYIHTPTFKKNILENSLLTATLAKINIIDCII